MSIVLNTDFTGKYEIAVDQFNETDINLYIAKYEKKFLIQLLGASLYTTFVADLVNGVPVTAIYLSIFNSFQIDSTTESINVSNGMKEMLKGFIYYHYLLDDPLKSTTVGMVVQKTETYDNVGMNGITNSRYNESVDTYMAIQSYINDNPVSYPTYNGQELKYNYFL